jgi:hypothetical protein
MQVLRFGLNDPKLFGDDLYVEYMDSVLMVVVRYRIVEVP